MATVPWWDGELNLIHGGSNLSGLDVYYDFSWVGVFGHGMSMFPHGKSLTRLIKRDCPAGKTPVLLLTERTNFETPWIEPGGGELIVVVPIRDYLDHSDPDPAASYYATRFGPGLTALKQLEQLATQGALEELAARRDVIEAVVRHGLTTEDVERWGSLEENHAASLAEIAATTAGTKDPAQLVKALGQIAPLGPALVSEIIALVQQSGADDPDAQADTLREFAAPLLADDAVRAAFVRKNSDLLEAIIRNEIAAPDVAALARRRETLEEFKKLLLNDDYFDERKRAVKGGAERVWQEFVEKNPWLLGSSLAPQFLHSWSTERLEQTVKGSSIAGPGKRPDAVLRTAGALSALVLCEIKHHRTDLLYKSYRGDAWSVSREIAGGVAQCQATSDEVERRLGGILDLKTEDGYINQRVFVCRPRTVLVAGTLSEFLLDGNVNPAQFESFERFRRGLRDPEILTFDELFERARLVLDLQSEAARLAE